MQHDKNKATSTEERAEPIRPFVTVTASAVGACIYCGSTDGLTKEHVVPYFLAGGLTIPKASCSKCSKITQKFEDKLSYTFFFALRRRYAVQSRSKGGPSTYPMTVAESEQIEQVRFEQLPPVVPWPIFERAGILRGEEPTDVISQFRLLLANISGLVSGPHLNGKFSIEVDFHLFMRLLAKMAHGLFVVAHGGSDWCPLLTDQVRFGDILPFYVGTSTLDDHAFPVPDAPMNGEVRTEPLQLHWSYVTTIPEDSSNEYLVMVLEPFSPAKCPRYEVVVARRRITGFALLQKAKEFVLPVSAKEQYKSQSARIHIEYSADVPST